MTQHSKMMEKLKQSGDVELWLVEPPLCASTFWVRFVCLGILALFLFHNSRAYAATVAPPVLNYLYFINNEVRYASSPRVACEQRNAYWQNHYNSQPNASGITTYSITEIRLFNGGLNFTEFLGVGGMPAYMVGTCQFRATIQTPTSTASSSGSISLWLEPPACPVNYRFNQEIMLCDDGVTPMPPPPPSHTYHIEIVPVAGNSQSDTLLASVEPRNATSRDGNDRVQLVARVFDETNSLVPDVNLRLDARVLARSGGHAHEHANRPTGLLRSIDNGSQGPGITGSTGPTGGGFVFFFTASEVAGDHILEAECLSLRCTHTGPKGVWVGIQRLEPIGTGPWSLTGARTEHPDNHYLTVPAFLVLQQLGLQWRRLYIPFGPVFRVNDASLVRGGLFDCCETYRDRFDVFHNRQIEGWWTPPHSEHRRGTVVDIGGIRRADEDEFEDYATRLGADAQIHGAGTGRHYHVRLRGIAE